MGRQTTVRVRVVTPMFLGGARVRQEGRVLASAPSEVWHPEARQQSLKGALRWWLRALLLGGGWAGPDLRKPDPEALWKEEAATFGSTEPSAGGASPVLLDMQESGPSTFYKHTGGGIGVRYLLYGMEESGRPDNDNHRGFRTAFAHGTCFDITLATRPGARGADLAMSRACGALWLLLAIGGLGARARHGAGCLVAEEVQGWPEGLPSPMALASAHTIRDLQEHLQAGLRQLRQTLAKQAYMDNLPKAVLTPYPVLHPDSFKIYLVDSRPWVDWGRAMDQIGHEMALFRQGVEEDTRQVVNLLQGQHPENLQAIRRSAFGLPLPFFFRQLGVRPEVRAEVNGKGHDRAAAPIALHFSALADGTLALAVTHSFCRILPKDEPVKVSGPGGATLAELPQPSPEDRVKICNEFLDYLKDQLDGEANYSMLNYRRQQ